MNPDVIPLNDNVSMTRKNTQIPALTTAARNEASICNTNEVNSLHILMALLRYETVASRALARHGVPAKLALSKTEVIDGIDCYPVNQDIQQSNEFKTIMSSAWSEMQRLEDNVANWGHALLALLLHPDFIACKKLMELGVDLESLRDSVIHEINSSSQAAG